MKRVIIKWVWLAVVFAILCLGGLILMLTPEYSSEHASATWGGLGLSALCLVVGVWLGYKLNKRNLLPE